MSGSVFTRIIRGEIPSHKIYEDQKTVAILDIHPKTPGHVMVIPKHEVKEIWDLPPDDYSALMASVKKVGLRIRQVLQPRHVGVQVEGLGVPHVHVHVFAFNTEDEFHARPDMGAEPDHSVLAQMAEKLAF
jgi:histidine triad (HIT) family protein